MDAPDTGLVSLKKDVKSWPSSSLPILISSSLTSSSLTSSLTNVVAEESSSEVPADLGKLLSPSAPYAILLSPLKNAPPPEML